MNKKVIYLISALATIAFTVALVTGIRGFIEETTFPEREYRLHTNESVELDGANVRVMQIIYSPCPENARCVWSGVGAIVRVERQGVHEERLLADGTNETVNGLALNLLEVRPEYVRMEIVGM